MTAHFLSELLSFLDGLPEPRIVMNADYRIILVMVVIVLLLQNLQHIYHYMLELFMIGDKIKLVNKSIGLLFTMLT